MAIVTRESINKMLNDPRGHVFVQHVIGKALVGIFNNQTSEEQASDITRVDNGIGFTGSDAYTGSMTAKYYLKHKALQPWMIDKWTKDFRGFPRICKYHRQLNTIAEQKKGV